MSIFVPFSGFETSSFELMYSGCVTKHWSFNYIMFGLQYFIISIAQFHERAVINDILANAYV